MRLGYLPDAPDARDWAFGESKLMTARPLSSAASFDYRSHDVARHQVGNSCVGQSLAAAAYLAMAIAGTPIQFPSALAIYSGARLLDDQAKPGAPRLSDWGCRPRSAMTFARDHGLVAESRWPETLAAMNAVPPLDVWQEGASATIEAFYRIQSGPGAADGMREALRRGYCPMFGMIVDSKYDQIGGGIYDSPGGTKHGGHAQVVIGFSAVLDAFIVRNTWGRAFGVNGYAWIAAGYMSQYATDIWVVTAAPPVG